METVQINSFQAVILINIGHPHSSQIPAHGQAEQSHLQSWQNELKQHEAGVAIDAYKVLPGQSKDVVGMRDVAVRVCGASAGVSRGSNPRHCKTNKTKRYFEHKLAS